jgi:NADPH2:quinone reductase
VSAPEGGPGTTLIDVLAAPINPIELAIASGHIPAMRHDDPYVPGIECVGRVVESDTFASGMLVFAELHPSPGTPGAFTPRVAAHDENVVELVPGVEPVVAAALGNAGVAAYLPLVERARLTAGESVVVLGATGAVGQLAVQIARAHGAQHVTAVGRNEKVLAELRGRGADATIALADCDLDALAGRLAAAGPPADVIIDMLYGIPLVAALRACAPGARIINVGNSADVTAPVPGPLLRGKGASITGFASILTPTSAKVSALRWLWTAARDGIVRIDITCGGLSEIATLWEQQRHSPHGKIVVVP